MPDQLQLRGGTTTEHNSFTGAAREVTVDTTKKTLVVHDGSQAGGTPLMKESGATAASSITFGTGGTERLKVLSNEIIINETGIDYDVRIESNNSTNIVRVDGGNDRVGINTSAPEEKLHVNGAFISTGSNNTASTAGSNRSIIDLTSGGTRIGHFRGTTSAGSGSLKLFVDSSEKMNIDSGGRVGIGTTTQNSVEDGAGLKVDNYIQRNATYHSPDGYYGTSLGEVTNGRTKVWAAVDAHYAQTNAVSAGLYLKAFHQDTGGSQAGFTIKNLKAGNPLTFSSVITAASVNNPAVENERMRLTSAGFLGLATAAPAFRLDIGDGTSDPVSGHQLRINAAGDYIFAMQKQSTPSFSIRNNSTSAVHINTQNSTRLALGVSTGNVSGSIESHLNIIDGGKVGIGTTSPSTRLDIREGSTTAYSATASPTTLGISNINSSANTNFAGIHMYSDGNGRGVVNLNCLNNSTSASADFTIQTRHAGTLGERLRITSVGNVGIGVTPTARLHVYKAAHYVVTDSGKATHGIHVRGNAGNAGEYGGAISFSCGDGDSSAAIAARQGGSDTDFTGLSFFTHPSGVAADDAVEKVRIHHSGEASFNDGICLGNGLTLSSANTLEDYEEGTFTMHFNVEGESNLTMSGRVGEYVKIGRTVHIIGGGTCGTVTNQATNKAISFTNLPFAMVNSSVNSTGHPFPVNFLELDSTGLSNMAGSQPYVFRGRLVNNGTNGRIVAYKGDGDQNPQNASLALKGNSQIYCMFTYQTAA